ncbi:hypothetical protein JL722_9897 [Aureococcus anophagefferens]|nr:hypothetical protein JL722_9897 [Aureococcus anophagefferens]
MLMAGLGSKRPLSCWVEAPGAPACEREWVYRAHALRGARRVRDADACFDDHCSVCIEGGALICCVSCPRAFHVACLERHVGAAFCPGAPARVADLGDRPAKKRRRARGRGARRDGETRLLCCDRCPRAFHARCAGVGAPGAALVAAGGRWRCAACADPPAGTADVDEAATLAAIENLCAKLPRTHFASLFGSRLAHLELGEALEQGGFATFKPRQAGRFDMVVPDLLEGVGGGPWRPVVEAVLGPGTATATTSTTSSTCRPALSVFLPLVDCGVRNGATEFAPRTHLDWRADARPVVVEAAAGDAIVFDWRLKHRGLPHRAPSRALVYLTYAAPWFVDDAHFSRDRFADLPPLVPASTRGDRAKRRGEAPPS